MEFLVALSSDIASIASPFATIFAILEPFGKAATAASKLIGLLP